MAQAPVVVAASGVLTALGYTEATLARVWAGETGVAPVPDGWAAGWPVARVTEPVEAFSRHRTTALALALLDAELGPVDPEGLAVVVATTTSGMREGEEAVLAWLEGRAPEQPEDFLWNGLPGRVAEAVAARLGATGPVLTTSTACTSGTTALGVGVELLRAGRARRALVVGADALCRVTFFGFRSLGAMTSTAVRPFDEGRDGMALGEGAAFLLLCRPEDAPGARLAVLGAASATDAYHLTAPDPSGAGLVRAVRGALGGATAEVVNAHATATPTNDAAEARALAEALPDAVVSGTKGATGHLLGAAGVVEAALLARALERGSAPPTWGLRAPVPGVRVSTAAAPVPARVGVSVNLAFGGHNAAVALAVREVAEAGVGGAEIARGEGTVAAARMVAAAVAEGGEPARPAAVDPGAWRRMSRPARLAAGVVAEVLGDEALARAWAGAPDDPGEAAARRAALGLVLATGVGEFGSSVAFLRSLVARGPAGASPLAFQTAVHSAAAGQLSIAFGLRGPADVLCGTGDWLPGALALAGERARAGVPTLLVAVDEVGPEVRQGFAFAGREPPPERAAALLLGAGAPAADAPVTRLAHPERDTDLIGPLVALAVAARDGAGAVALERG